MSLDRIIRKVRQWPLSPIDAMTTAGEGLFHLPVEIWKKIFEEVTEDNSHPFHIHAVNPLSPPNTLLCEEEPSWHNLNSWRAWVCYDPLRPMTCVCKAWYILVNPLLWSHLFIDLSHSPKLLQNLCQTLKRNKSLAQHVTCIMIRGLSGGWGYNESQNVEEMGKISLIQDVFPKLVNLKMIACPRSIVEKANWSIQPEVVYIYEKADYSKEVGSLIYGNHFWHQASTLILIFVASSQLPLYPANHPNPVLLAPTFHRLVNLTMRVEDVMAICNITTLWSFPVLRSFSIRGQQRGQAPPTWTYLLRRVRQTLETLEILISFESGTAVKLPAITMPKLRSLCLQVPMVDREGNTIQWWLNYITAPRLFRLVFHHNKIEHHFDSWFYVGRSQQPWENPRKFYSQVDTGIMRYPTIRELRVVADDLEYAFPTEEKWYEWILGWEEVRRWCTAGIRLEMVDSFLTHKWVCTADSFEASETQAQAQ